MCPFCVSFFCFLFVCSSTVVVASSDIPADEKDEISLLLKILKDHRTSMNTSATVESTETTNRLQVETENPLKSYSCPENEFYCGVEDTCIESIRLCDGGLDCSDGSDEVDCFECKYDFPHGRLIRTDQVCDGVSDCRHGEDEHACKTSCGNAEFACNEGDIGTACIPDEWKCDSVPDCPDIEDESVQLCGERLGKCGVDQFVCGHRLFCIPEIWRCDGEQDCGDHSDEDDCDEDGVDRQHSMTNASRFEWGDWGIWSSCNSNCDGERTRSRKCRFGDCVGKRDDVQTCGDSYPCVTEPSKGCGTRVFEVPSGRVVGGRDAQLNEWPWQVQIFRPGRAIPFCGGSLIKQSWVLTVAHCFYRKKFSADEYFVAVGRRHTSRRLADDDEQYVHVRSIIINEEYDKPSHMNDIALLRLQKEVTVNHGANLVCLPSIEASWLKDDQQKSLDCFVTGFGVNQMGRRPATMQEAKVNLIDRKTCRKPYVYGNRITESMICAGHMQGGIDACQGDSGGPLVCQHPEEGRWYQVGITSWGKGCGLPNRPGVYTYVSSFHRWIHANLLDPSDMQK